MNAWPIYISLQTALAYGSGLGGRSEWAAETCSLTTGYVRRIRRERRLRGSLIIGPGGPDEIRQLREVMPAPLLAITAHPPELIHIANILDDGCAVRGDIHDLPFETAAFDVLFASNVLEHCLAPYVALLNCRRVLRGGGLAIFVLPSFEGRDGGQGPFHLHCLDRPVWLELLRKTGFTIADVHVQPGDVEAGGHFVHYRCVAGELPEPHGRIMKELITYDSNRRTNEVRD